MKSRFSMRIKHGFTLAELLIVVAIIGVLVAISIPIFSAQLEKAREGTDIANMRAAKAAAIAAYLYGLSGDEDEDKCFPFMKQAIDNNLPDVSAFYDPATGQLTASSSKAAPGNGTTYNPSGQKMDEFKSETGLAYDFDGDMRKARIRVTISFNLLDVFVDDAVVVDFTDEVIDYSTIY